MIEYSSDLSGYIIVTDLRHVKFLVTLTHFQGHSLVCRISLEPIDGFSSNLHRYTTRTSLRADYILVTWISFSRFQENLNMLSFT